MSSIALEQLFDILPENYELRIVDINDKELARYDGRNSIPEKFNKDKIYEIRILRGDCLKIILDLFYVD